MSETNNAAASYEDYQLLVTEAKERLSQSTYISDSTLASECLLCGILPAQLAIIYQLEHMSELLAEISRKVAALDRNQRILGRGNQPG